MRFHYRNAVGQNLRLLKQKKKKKKVQNFSNKQNKIFRMCRLKEGAQHSIVLCSVLYYTVTYLSWRNVLSCVSLFISDEDGDVDAEVVKDNGDVTECILFLGTFLGTFPGTFLRSKGITPHMQSPRSFCSRRELISVIMPRHFMLCQVMLCQLCNVM